MTIETCRRLTYGQLISSNKHIVPRVQHAERLGTPRKYIELAISVGDEIRRHFANEEEFISLKEDSVLPSSIADKFFELVDYPNELYPIHSIKF